YANVTTTPYRYNTAITGMAVNQPNEATQSLVIKGGSFSQYDPQLGDDSGKMTDFTDEGFVAIQDGNGNWVVQPGYNVTFDANGGSPAPAAQRVAVGGTATAPTAPTAANRDFLGWFASGATAAYDFTAEVVADLVLTAAWDASYTASFDKDAYTATGGGVMSMKVTIIRADGETLTTADKDGWTLEYDSPRLESSGTPVWSLSKGTVTYKAKRNDAGFDTATGTVNLKRGDRVYDTATISVAPSATWTFTPSIANGAKRMVESGPVTVSSVKVNGIAVDLADYTVTSDDDSLATVVQDGSSATVTPVAAGKAAFTLADGNGGTLPLSVTFVDAVAKIGMTFYDSVSAAVKAVADGETIQLVANTTESQVSVSKDCAFTIDLAGKVWTATAGSYSALKMSKGLVTLEDSSEDGTGVVQGSGELDGAHYGISFDQVANDAAVNKLVVRGGTVQGVSHAVIIGNKVDSTKKFFGGSLEVYGGKFIATLDTADTLDPNGHVRATINYLDVPSGYTVYGAPSATIYGGSFYNFDPADNVAEGAGTSFLPATGYVSVADDPSSGWFTVYEAVTVTFVNDKGAAPEAQVIGKGKTATEPADPAAVAGFRFDGWFAEGAEEAFDFDTAIAADLTLTAKWTPTTATVIWVVEGTQTEETYDIGATPVYPGATPTKAGTDSSVYVFTGWSPALGEVTAAGATYTAQFSLVSLSPASLELYPNCSNYVQVVGAPAGSTYTYKFAGQVGADSYLANPPGWSKTEGWAWPYGKQPGGTGTITVTVTNDNAQIAVLTANVTVKDVAAVVDGVEYASAQFGDALNAAKTGDKVLEVYYYASGYAKVALGADESIRWKPADNRGKASFWTSAVTVPATTDTDWYKAIASKDAATGVTTVTCESQGAPYVKIDDGTTVTYSTSSFPTMSTAGATYTMLRDITRTSAIVTSASGVVLDLNGYTLTLTKGSMNVKGGLTVKDDSEAGTGTIAKTTATGTDTKLFLVNGGGTVAITGGAYESAGEILYTDETAGSAATISGGTFSSTAADTAFLLNCSD
ncbi:MAG: InlB B-repeat-containing protein, partial [Kiritimatiellae bacterium]|nr:InlB B-repeat-containing protein [Kiritimatiellia bacterium]